MDNKVLVYSTRGASSKQSQSLFEEMAILKELANSIDYMRFTKTSAAYNKIKDLSGLDNLNQTSFNYTEFYMNEVASRKLTDWDDIIDKIDINPLKDYDRFYIFGGILNLACANRPKAIRSIKEFPYPLCKVWVSIGVQYIHICAILKAHLEFNIPITEIMHDPQEANLGLIETEKYKVNKNLYDLKFNYAIPELNATKFDGIQYFLKNKSNQLSVEKDIDFTFGYSIVTTDRQFIIESYINIIHNIFNEPQIFVKDKFNKINNFINRDEYLKYIARSKYTLIVPSYDVNHVSIIRIIEAVHHNCIPLFTDNNNFSALLNSFPDFNYKDFIISEDWVQFSDIEYEKRLNHCKEIFLTINY